MASNCVIVRKKKKTKAKKFTCSVRYSKSDDCLIYVDGRTTLLLFIVCRTIFSTRVSTDFFLIESAPVTRIIFTWPPSRGLILSRFSPRESCSIRKFCLVSLVKPQFGKIYSFFLSRAAVPVIKCLAKLPVVMCR